MADNNCPTPEQLSDIVRGVADEDRTERIFRHAETCDRCAGLLDSLLRQGDSLIGRTPHSEPSSLLETLVRHPGEGGRATGAMKSDHSFPPGRAAGHGPMPAVPAYEILQEVGRGGMGVVYKARHLALNRLVALKMILSGDCAGEEQRLRFRVEAELAARVQHPGIVQVFEVGEHEGKPFLALEWIDGGSLSQYLAGKPRPSREAAWLVEQLARAVQAAHNQGVIHRDLKPANVLLAVGQALQPDSGGEIVRLESLTYVPKITDFGLAKSSHSDSGLTQTGAIVGTPEYMAPEQAEGHKQVGTSADVYALGAILYEMLTGKPPLRGKNVLDTLLLVRTAEPAPVRSIAPGVPADLDTICLKCLRKQPEKRYASAEALADDLKRWQTGEPIQARRVGELERAWLWARRNPTIAAALAAVVLALLGGSAVAAWFGLDAQRQAEKARASEKDAIEARNLARQTADDAVKDRDKAQKAEKTANLSAAVQSFRLGLQQAEAGAVDMGLFLMLQAWRQAPQGATSLRTIIRINLAGWSRQLPRLRNAFRVRPLAGDRFIQLGDSDGRTLLLWSQFNKAMQCWDVVTGKPVGPLLQPPGGASFVAWGTNEQWAMAEEERRRGCLIDRATGKELPGISWPHSPVNPVSFEGLPDILRFVENDRLRFREVPSGKWLPGWIPAAHRRKLLLTRTTDHRPVAVVFHPEKGQGSIDTVDLTTGKPAALPLAGTSHARISHDGRFAIQIVNYQTDKAAGVDPPPRDGVVWWDMGTGQPLLARWQPRRDSQLFLSRDSLELHAPGNDCRLRCYDVATGYQRGGDCLADGSGFEDLGCAFGPDGRWTFTVERSSIVRVWDSSLCGLQTTIAANPNTAPGVSDPSEAPSVFFSPDRSHVALNWRAKNLGVLLDCHTGELLAPPLRQTAIEHLAFDADGRFLVTATYQSRNVPMVILRDGQSGEPIGKPWVSPRLIYSLAFSPDGKTVAVGVVGGTYILDVPALSVRHHLAEATCIKRLLFHPDSRRLVTAAQWGWPGVAAGLRVWDVWTGQPLAPFRRESRELAPQISWEGGDLLSYSRQRSVLERLSPDGKELRGEPLTTERVGAAIFSPDGSRLAGSASAMFVRQWGTRMRKPIGAILAHRERGTLIHQEGGAVAAYSSDNRVLAVASGEHSVVLWDAETGWPLGPPLVHARRLQAIAFAAQDRTLLTVTRDGGVHAWPILQPVVDEPERFESWLYARGGRRLVDEETVELSLEEWQAARRTLEQRWPKADPALVELSDDEAAWHRECAAHAAEVGNDRGEWYHLTRLAALPNHPRDVHARIAAVHARVAARLPKGLARDREWQHAWAAAKRGVGRAGEDNWDRLRVADALARQSWDEALWYLDFLLDRNPSDWQLAADRADVHGKRGMKDRRDADLRSALAHGGNEERGFVLNVVDSWSREDRWDEVAKVLNDSPKSGRTDLNLARRLALVHLKRRDRPAHGTLCQSLLRSLPPNAHPDLAAMVVELCTLSPETMGDWSSLLKPVQGMLRNLEAAGQKATGDEKKMFAEMRRTWLTLHGAVLHRAGRSAESIVPLKEAIKLSPDGKGGPDEWVLLALARTKSAPQEAKRWLDQARSALPSRDGEGLWQAVVLELLVAEATEALKRAAEL